MTRHVSYPSLRQAFVTITILVTGLLSSTWPCMSPYPVMAQGQRQQNPEVPRASLLKAIEFVKEEPSKSSSTLENSVGEIVMRLKQGDVHTLYSVAKSMNASSRHRPDYKMASMELWHALADSRAAMNSEGGGHVLSQVALGFAYAKEDKQRAIAYFVQAGEGGPHQAALYNAGRLLAEEQDFVKALAYLRGAYSLHLSDPKYANDKLTETSRVAYELLSEQLVAAMAANLDNDIIIDVQQVADMFLYADLSDFPTTQSREGLIWKTAMHAMQDEDWDLATQQIEKLSRVSGDKLSSLQSTLLQILQEYSAAAGRGSAQGVGEL